MRCEGLGFFYFHKLVHHLDTANLLYVLKLKLCVACNITRTRNTVDQTLF